MPDLSNTLPEAETQVILYNGRFIEQRINRRDLGTQSEVITRYAQAQSQNQDSKLTPLTGLEFKIPNGITGTLGPDGDFKEEETLGMCAAISPRRSNDRTSYYTIQRLPFMPFRGNFIKAGKNVEGVRDNISMLAGLAVYPNLQERFDRLNAGQCILVPRGDSGNGSQTYSTRLYMGPRTYLIGVHSAFGDEIAPENLFILSWRSGSWYVYNIPNLGSSGGLCTGNTNAFGSHHASLKDSHMALYDVLHENPFNFDLFDGQNMVNIIIDAETKASPKYGHPFHKNFTDRASYNRKTFPLTESSRVVKHLTSWCSSIYGPTTLLPEPTDEERAFL